MGWRPFAKVPVSQPSLTATAPPLPPGRGRPRRRAARVAGAGVAAADDERRGVGRESLTGACLNSGHAWGGLEKWDMAGEVARLVWADVVLPRPRGRVRG